MDDKQLAQALYQAGLLTQDQIRAAAEQRAAGMTFAEVVVRNGWVTSEQIRQVSGGTFGAGAPSVSTPSTGAPSPWGTTAAPPPAAPPPYQPVGAVGPYESFNTAGVDSAGMNPNAEVRFEAIGTAWGLLKAQMGTWVATTIIFVLAIYIVQAPFMVPYFREVMDAQASGRQPVPNTGAQLVSGLVGLVVTAFLLPGLLKMALKQIDGEPIAIGDLFNGASFFGNMLLAFILYYIAAFIGVFACCIGYFVALTGFSFAFPLVVDKNLAAVEAMKQSWAALKSHILMLLLLYIVVSLCSMLGALACGIGIFITYPLLFLTPMVVYREFFPNPRAATRGYNTPGMGGGGSEFRPPIPDPNSSR